MNFKAIFKLGFSALILSMLTFSCTQDTNEIEILDTPEIPLLKEKLPEVHELIDFNSYQQHEFLGNDGNTYRMEGYEAKENGVVVGYYAEVENEIVYTAVAERKFVQTNLLTDQQVVIPRVYDEEKGRLVPNFERLMPLEQLGIDSEIAQGRGPCEDLCIAGWLACRAGCIGIDIISDLPLPEPMDVVLIATVVACKIGCNAALAVCLALC